MCGATKSCFCPQQPTQRSALVCRFQAAGDILSGRKVLEGWDMWAWQLRQPRPGTWAPGWSYAPPGAGGGEEGPETQAVLEATSPASVP